MKGISSISIRERFWLVEIHQSIHFTQYNGAQWLMRIHHQWVISADMPVGAITSVLKVKLYFLSNKQRTTSHLADGATMIPRNMRRPTTIGCEGGISKMCFKKNVFSSEICQNITIWQTAKNLIYVLLGSSQRTCVQLTGVNWRTALFSLPVVDRISLHIKNIQMKINLRNCSLYRKVTWELRENTKASL